MTDSNGDPSADVSATATTDVKRAWSDVDAKTLVTLLYEGLLKRPPEEGAVESWVRGLEGGLSAEDMLAKFLRSDEFLRQQREEAGLFVPPGHFYSPIVDPVGVAHLFDGEGEARPTCVAGIDMRPDRQLALWQRFLPHFRRIPFPWEPSPAFRYHFDNPAYSIGDASIYFGFLMEFRPKRIVEVGSGYSSACAVDTIQRFFDHPVDMDFIEPFPARLNTLLGDATRQVVRVHAHGVQQAELALFERLNEGDILFIDSTHVLKTGSDVHFILFEVLPRLKKGVLIHLHDMFWPFEYPRPWVINQNRSWNELYAVRAFLMFQDLFEVVFFNDFFRTHHLHVIQETYPDFLRKTGGALWLRKTR